MANHLADVPRFRHPGNPNRNEDEPPPPQPVVNFWEEQVPGHGNGRQRHGRRRHRLRRQARVPRVGHPGNPVPPVARVPENPALPVARVPENPVIPVALVPRLQRHPARVPRLQHTGNAQPPASDDDDYVDIDRIDPQPFREEILPPPIFLGGITVRAEPGTSIRLFTLGSVDEEIDENDDNPRHCMLCLVNKATLSTSCCPTNPSVCKNCMHVLFVGKFVGRQCLNCQRYTVDYVLNSN